MNLYNKINTIEGVNLSDHTIDAIIKCYEDSLWHTDAPDISYYGKEILAEFQITGYEIVIPSWTGYQTKDGVMITSPLIRWRPI